MAAGESQVQKPLDVPVSARNEDRLIRTEAAGKTYAMLEAARHVMRYQDVQELLRSGINVFTTVNVQHLESLNDKVAAITGVSLAECIPDSVFDSAAPARPWGTSSPTRTWPLSGRSLCGARRPGWMPPPGSRMTKSPRPENIP